MGKIALKHHYSIEEYLKIEKKSIERYEYHAGEIFAMVGGSIIACCLR